MRIDQVISLASSVAAMLAAKAALLTVWEMVKQRRASYRPELVISSAMIEAEDQHASDALTSLLHWRTLTIGDTARNLEALDDFAVHLANVGLGAAMAVVVHWQFPMEEFVLSVRKVSESSKFANTLSFKNGVVSLEVPTLSSIWKNQRTEVFDYVLPASINSDPRRLKIPHAYIVAVSAAAAVMSGRGVLDSLEVPALRANVVFKDIAGDEHQTVFDLKMVFIKLSAASFWARLESGRVHVPVSLSS